MNKKIGSIALALTVIPPLLSLLQIGSIQLLISPLMLIGFVLGFVSIFKNSQRVLGVIAVAIYVALYIWNYFFLSTVGF